MTLIFPTLAEQTLEAFRAAPKTTAINPLAEAAGAFRADEGREIVWIFPDDTSLRITGRGRGHKVEAFLP